MFVLALETSVRPGSIAVGRDETLLGEAELDDARPTTQTLIPALRDLLARSGLSVRQIERVAVTEGPGSFTGLRVAVTSAKTLAYAMGADTVGCNSLDVIAAQVKLKTEIPAVDPAIDTPAVEIPAVLHAVMDAQRQELFVRRYRWQADGWQTTTDVSIERQEDWLASLSSRDLVTGPVLVKLRDRLPPEVGVVDSDLWLPHARTLVRLATLSTASVVDPLALVPRYYRKSAAEEKANR